MAVRKVLTQDENGNVSAVRASEPMPANTLSNEEYELAAQRERERQEAVRNGTWGKDINQDTGQAYRAEESAGPAPIKLPAPLGIGHIPAPPGFAGKVPLPPGPALPWSPQAAPKTAARPTAGGVGADFGATFKPWETIDSRVSQDQWKAWEPMRDSKCPQSHPYKAERTFEDGSNIPGCFEKPVDCPPGTTALDRGGRNMCVSTGSAAVGGGGATRGPGSGDIRTDPAAGLQYNLRQGHATMVPGNSGLAYNIGGGTADNPAECWKVPSGEKVPCPGNIGQTLRANGVNGSTSASSRPGAPGDMDSFLRNLIQGSSSRYSPEAIQKLQGQVTSNREAAVRRGTADVMQNAAARGMSRSGKVEAALRGVRDAAESAAGQQNVNIMTEQINADAQDKLAAIDRAQRYLDSLRENEYRNTLTGEQRRQFDANLALSYANLEQQRANLQTQLQSSWNMFNAQQGYNALMMGV